MRKFFQFYSYRINILSLAIIFFSFILLLSFFRIQIIQQNQIKKIVSSKGFREIDIYGERGKILDRNNKKLSETINKYDFWVNTNQEIDKDYIITIFSRYFNKPDSHYKKILYKKSNYIKIEKNVSFLECKEIIKKINEIKGLRIEKKSTRFYPNNNLACQTLGYVDLDGFGQGGIEGNFNTILSGDTTSVTLKKGAKGKYYNQKINQNKNIDGKDITLTIDIDIQNILQDELNKIVSNTNSISANGIIIEPFTGDIIAMVSIPDFNPNNYFNYNIENYRNRVIAEQYEPGSTFKIIPLLAAIEKNNISLEKKYYCENGKFFLTRNTLLRDHEPHDTLSMKEIFIHSSNIGISKVVADLDNRAIYELCKNFGFGTKTGLPFKNESKGKLRKLDKWTRNSKTYVSIGQEISITNIQLALAYCAIANGGYLIKPNIVKTISKNDSIIYKRKITPIRKIFTLESSLEILDLLSEVVNYGTAKNLNLHGYNIGGKTGTAQKFIDGKYSDNKFVSSFVSILPITNPKYIIIVTIDSPRYGKHWSNESAVPVSRNIINRIIINDKSIYSLKKKPPILAYNQNADQTFKLGHSSLIYSEDNMSSNKVPNLRGKSLKEALEIANSMGIKLDPLGLSGKIVWQSLKPGSIINNRKICKVKLAI